VKPSLWGRLLYWGRVLFQALSRAARVNMAALD
jgi:hypothetical protein